MTLPPVQNHRYDAGNGGKPNLTWWSNIAAPMMDMFLGTTPGPGREFLSKLGQRPRPPIGLSRDYAELVRLQGGGADTPFSRGLDYTLAGRF